MQLIRVSYWPVWVKMAESGQTQPTGDRFLTVALSILFVLFAKVWQQSFSVFLWDILYEWDTEFSGSQSGISSTRSWKELTQWSMNVFRFYFMSLKQPAIMNQSVGSFLVLPGWQNIFWLQCFRLCLKNIKLKTQTIFSLSCLCLLCCILLSFSKEIFSFHLLFSIYVQPFIEPEGQNIVLSSYWN